MTYYPASTTCASTASSLSGSLGCNNLGTTTSYSGVCDSNTATFSYYNANGCPTGGVVASGSRNITQGNVCFRVGSAGSAFVDCSSGAAMLAVSSALLAILAFAANRFTL